MLPKIVIVGRPNVGKSSLLNLLAGRLVSIVDPTPGVTRDRISTMGELPQLLATQTRSRRRRGADRTFEADDEVESARPDNKPLPVELIDTGGYGIEDSQNLTAEVERQISLGLAEADVILFVIDAQSGILALDTEVARLLRNSAGKKGKPVLLVANKVDSEKDESGAAEASRLGFGPPLMVSALSGNNKELLTEAIRANLPRAATSAPDARAAELGVLLAIVGKRNAGKSTLVNALSGQDRMIVSELEGTTRDSVDVRFEHGNKVFTAIDTAGVRKTKSLKGDVEFYSQHRALRSIRRADVVLLLLDATLPVSHVDQQLAHEIVTHFKPAMIVVNKWDLAEKALERDLATQDKYMEYLDKHLAILSYAPVAFISAKRDEGLRELLDMAMKLHRQAAERVSTSGLNKTMEEAMAAKPPSSGIGRRPRVYYMTQLATQPPTIILFVNDPTMFDPAYQRYLINRFRETLPFAEVPIRLIIRGRNDNEGPDAPPRPDKKRRSKA